MHKFFWGPCRFPKDPGKGRTGSSFTLTVRFGLKTQYAPLLYTICFVIPSFSEPLHGSRYCRFTSSITVEHFLILRKILKVGSHGIGLPEI